MKEHEFNILDLCDGCGLTKDEVREFGLKYCSIAMARVLMKS